MKKFHPMKTQLSKWNCSLAMLLSFAAATQAQVNSGSNGSDGAFNPTTNIVINMADHPNGIYQYTSVNIPSGVTVTFIPNANNSPVIWLVQSNVAINGFLGLAGQDANSPGQGGQGGPGGYPGGHGGTSAESGQGPGGGLVGCSASYGSVAGTCCGISTNGLGRVYGNQFLIPLVGGSGGGGSSAGGGGGGGGTILIVANGEIHLDGRIAISGGSAGALYTVPYSGAGSGGAIRLVASKVSGLGDILANGGAWISGNVPAGFGRVRFDTLWNNFGGQINGVFTQGYQPIIIPTNGQTAQLTVTSVGGVPVSASPTGQFSTPDAVLSAQQNNPIPIVVHCSNIPLNTQITVSVKPANGAAVSATGLNSTGTLSSSTATVSIVMPRGGGIIYATAATGN